MGRRSWIEWHDNGALVWTWPLTLIVSGVGVLLLGVAAGLWVARSLAGAARGDELLVLLAAFGVVALIVAVGGRLTSAGALRYRDVPLAQVSAESVVTRRVRRRSVRRRSGIAYGFMALAVPGLMAGVVANWNTAPRGVNLAVLALAVGSGAGCYLAGPAARFAVTPRHLRIDTALHRTIVPRHLMDTFVRRDTKVRLRLTNDGHIDFRVDSPMWEFRGGEYRHNDRTQTRTVERIVAMLAQTPADDHSDDGIVVTARRGMIALAIAATLLSVAALIALPIAAQG
jgi:hypothetical protein